MRAPCALILIAMTLAGCGHRGPLYLPGRPGDPAYDRQHRDAGTAIPPAPIQVPAPVPKAPNDKPDNSEE